MTSEIRANKQTNRAGLGTVTYADTGIIVSGIVTANSLGGIGHINLGSNIQLGNAGIITASSYRGDGSQLTGITGTTINNNADNRVITGSGTANTLNGESGLTFSNNGVLEVTCASGINAYHKFINPSGYNNALYFESSGGTLRGLIGIAGGGGSFSHTSSVNDLVIRSNNHLVFGTGGNQGRVRIDSSGRMQIGTTTEGHSNADDLTIATSGTTGITLRSASGYAGNIAFSDGTSGQDEYRGFIHWDYDPDTKPQNVQGVLALADQTDLEMGGFQCIPWLYKNYDTWRLSQPEERNKFQPDISGLEDKIVKVSLEAGDLLIFNSTQPHGIRPNNSKDKVRIAQYISMMPAQEDDTDLVNWRINSWKNRIAPEGYAFPGDPRNWEQEKYGTAKLSKLGEKILGLEKW